MTTTTKTRARRPGPRRPPARRQPAAAAAPAGSYQQWRAVALLGLFVVFFGWLWLLNGSFTAGFVMALFRQPAEVGWAAHIITSFVELAPVVLARYMRLLPKQALLLVWLLSLPWGVFDVLSSAVGVAPWFEWTGAAGAWANLQNVVLAEFIGFTPERMIVWLLIAIVAIMKGGI